MSYPVYYVLENDTLPVLFDSFDGGTGASITLTGLATTDIEIYKDGGTTQRSSDAGYTLLDTDGIDFDTITGIHGFSIDLSNNSDAGFYAVGPWYHVVVSSVTVDAQTVNFIACAFRILDTTRGMAGTALPDAAADAAGGLPISDAGGLDLDGLNTNVSSILTDTGTTLDNHLTDIKGTAFVKDTHSLTNIEGYADLIDDGTSGLAKIATDVAAVLVDTNSLNDTKIPDTISLAAINAEVDSALDTAIPGVPTANSINERIAAIDDKLPSGTISDFDETANNVTVGTNSDKTGYSISGTKTTLDALNDLSAAQVNAEVDSALDTAIPGTPTANSINERVKAVDDKLPSGTISDFDESADNVTVATDGITATSISSGALDDIWGEVIESQGSYTARQILSVALSVLAGVTSGGGATLKTPDGVATRVSATIDVSNNRTAMSLTPSA